VLLLVASIGSASAIRGEAPTPQGGEFRVNGYTSDYQAGPAIALDGAGSFVVVWQSHLQDGDEAGIFARRWSAVGVAQGLEFQVNSHSVGAQERPSVARDTSGDFVVVWESAGQDGSSDGVFARRFAANGAAQGVEFQVNSYTPGSQEAPVIAVDTVGNFVVAWTSDQDGSLNGVFARRFAADGTPLAGEFQVNAYTAGHQYHSAIAMDSNGEFVVAWVSVDQDGSNNGVFARRFDSFGSPQASEFQASTYTTGDQWFPSVALDGDGDFVVAWASEQDGSNLGVFARRFNAAGVAQASEFQVNTYTLNYQYNAVVAMDLQGDFAVTWSSYSQDGSNYGVFGRRFDSAGVPQAAEFRVNSYTPSQQIAPSIEADDDGDFVVTWISYDQDGDQGGIFAQRYGKLAVLDIDGSGDIRALTDGLLVLRFLFGFTGTTLITGAVDVANCSRCTAGDIQIYLATLI
jgi:hypothetical protein